jgi:hypothetical protein
MCNTFSQKCYFSFIVFLLFYGAFVFNLQVNVVEGLKLYENLLDRTEVSKLVSLVNDLRVAGRKGQLQGKWNVSYVFILEESITALFFFLCFGSFLITF